MGLWEEGRRVKWIDNDFQNTLKPNNWDNFGNYLIYILFLKFFKSFSFSIKNKIDILKII